MTTMISVVLRMMMVWMDMEGRESLRMMKNIRGLLVIFWYWMDGESRNYFGAFGGIKWPDFIEIGCASWTERFAVHLGHLHSRL
jgi:hypothetical protein